MKKIALLLILLLELVSLLAGCIPSSYSPPSIVTPESIDRVEPNHPHLGIFSWRYDNQMLVFRSICNECGTHAALSIYNWRTDQVTQVPLPGYLPDRIDPAQGPDPNIIAYTRDGVIHLFNLANHVDQQIVDGTAPAFSPESSQFAFARGQSVYVYDFNIKQERILFTWNLDSTDERMFVNTLDWSPDGGKIAYPNVIYKKDGGEVDTVGYLDPIHNTEYQLERGSFIGSATWSPDGRLLTYVRNPVLDQAELVISEPANACVVGTKKIPGVDGTSFWSPDGRVILISYFGDLYFVNVETVFGKSYRELSCGNNLGKP